MSLSNDIRLEVGETFRETWNTRGGHTVPVAEDVQLGNNAVELEGAVLYADIANSTGMVETSTPTFAAEVYKAFLRAACLVIRANQGEITAFDGDRVMAVFIGEAKCSNAARTALQINYVVTRIIREELVKVYPESKFKLKHGVGIDMSKLLIARTGIRGSNDLVWVGRAANNAAKLCALRLAGYSSYISESVYNALNETSKYGADLQTNMWNAMFESPFDFVTYSSNWLWEPN